MSSKTQNGSGAKSRTTTGKGVRQGAPAKPSLRPGTTSTALQIRTNAMQVLYDHRPETAGALTLKRQTQRPGLEASRNSVVSTQVKEETTRQKHGNSTNRPARPKTAGRPGARPISAHVSRPIAPGSRNTESLLKR